ncbi:hypothetical protein DRQ25_16560 [Candidatus Fermentibacteria bacterium]|nr:MAG: hypothetical protein DRQ25_16560 [Candidatus Fermentibacteria bacterium]
MTKEYAGFAEGSLLFQEQYAMAQSQKNGWTKSVNTWKCITINLSATHLQVKLHGLFGLIVKPFNADLDHTIPITDITSVEKRKNYFGYNEISVVFRLRSGGERQLLLYLKRGEEFLNLLNSMMN